MESCRRCRHIHAKGNGMCGMAISETEEENGTQRVVLCACVAFDPSDPLVAEKGTGPITDEEVLSRAKLVHSVLDDGSPYPHDGACTCFECRLALRLEQDKETMSKLIHDLGIQQRATRLACKIAPDIETIETLVTAQRNAIEAVASELEQFRRRIERNDGTDSADENAALRDEVFRLRARIDEPGSEGRS